MNSQVSVARSLSYKSEDMNRAAKLHFSALKLDEKLKPDMRIVIKPNLVMKRSPDDATTTHPAFIAAVIRRLKAAGITDITIAESPGGPYTASALKIIYSACGIEEMAKAEGVKLNYDVSFKNLKCKDFSVVSDFDIITPLAEADFIINICKLKTHGMVNLSAGVKNMFGAIPGLKKPEMHYRFPDVGEFGKMLCDLYGLVTPAVTFVDAVEAMEGNGPSGGNKKYVGLTFAAYDAFSLDLAMCDLIGLSPRDVSYLAAGIEKGLCAESFNRSLLCGETEAFKLDPPFEMPESKSLDFTSKFPKLLRRPVHAVMDKFVKPKPFINKNICVGCGKCAESCPMHTIKIVDKKAKIGYSKCIKCYCCHEMCPVRAIEFKRFMLIDKF